MSLTSKLPNPPIFDSQCLSSLQCCKHKHFEIVVTLISPKAMIIYLTHFSPVCRYQGANAQKPAFQSKLIDAIRHGNELVIAIPK